MANSLMYKINTQNISGVLGIVMLDFGCYACKVTQSNQVTIFNFLFHLANLRDAIEETVNTLNCMIRTHLLLKLIRLYESAIISELN